MTHHSDFRLPRISTFLLIAVSLFLLLPGDYALADPVQQAEQQQVVVSPDMVTAESKVDQTAGAMFDEQDLEGEPVSSWNLPSQYWKSEFPLSATIDLKKVRNLAIMRIYDTNGIGEIIVQAGEPGDWTEAARFKTDSYKSWKDVPLNINTRYLRITRQDGGTNFAEIKLLEYTPEGYAEYQRQQAEAEARRVMIARAEAEAANRPVSDLGSIFGHATLVDRIDVSSTEPGHRFTQDPARVSQTEPILGHPCRVLTKTEGECAYLSFRIGEMKALKPGATYLLRVVYPEDQPRTVIVMNGGNESIHGFHTGMTFGDAFHPKYVNNNNESLQIPLSGRYESWDLVFQLHDRFPELKFIRGEGERRLTPDDGFPITICQFSAANIPASHGAAVREIALYELVDPVKQLDAQYQTPPEGLPQRHLFWREEMADGVISSKKDTERGVNEPLDWYRYKLRTLRFLGMNTYTKDLLEFGACQHWDSSGGGGNDWVFFDSSRKDLWRQIVQLMGDAGMSVLPYYEYSGSKGYHGLGNERRAKPLSRDDAYTHIGWIESSNADLTDPDTYDDFRKMLELTVVRHKDLAPMIGAWIRPRSQLPIGFGEATLARFARETNQRQIVTREMLREDTDLLKRYYTWWFVKRREFLIAMRDYLANSGVTDDPLMLFTTDASEPGVSFPNWDHTFVTDSPEFWSTRLKEANESEERPDTPLLLADVLDEGQYAAALLAPRLTWGGWEVHHANPWADPQNFQNTPGVLLTHCFNRAYTVGDPDSFDMFRGPAGLAIVRHFSLNENMMFDRNDQEKLGYFVADIERAGPYCMLVEARAMANGDPTHIAYLAGNCYGRGFPVYVRNFNAAFLSLPALPSTVVPDAASDTEVVVRRIDAGEHGQYLAIVNTGLTAKTDVQVTLPIHEVTAIAPIALDAPTGKPIAVTNGQIPLDLYPCQLRAVHLPGR